MSKKTIDIVLLPDLEMTQHAIDVSRAQSVAINDQRIILNSENCLPHISLAMGGIDEQDLGAIQEILADIGSQFQPLDLIADIYQGLKIPTGEIVSEFNVLRNAQIDALHREVMDRVSPFLSHDDLSTKMVFAPPAVDEITLFWIKNYPKNSSYDRFRPHITTGFGMVDQIKTPIHFTASTLALCHLGNYCTCRDKLSSVQLQ